MALFLCEYMKTPVWCQNDMDTKALHFHFTAGHLNMRKDEFAIGSGNSQKWEVTIRETLEALELNLFKSSVKSTTDKISVLFD